MRKILPLLILILIGCSSYKPIRDIADKTVKPSTGVVVIAALIEANTNFSSLLFDKTKAKFDAEKPLILEHIDNNKKLFVAPVKIVQKDKIRYDETIRKAFKNYFRVNKFAVTTDNISDADYIVVVNMRNSIQRIIGKNYSKVEVTVFDKKENIVYFSKVKALSESDDNFWYFPSKDAQPVSYLNLKVVEYIFENQLIKLFQREA